jgi:histidinol-phosphate aminotransferase
VFVEPIVNPFSELSKPYLNLELLNRPDWTQVNARNPNAIWLDKNENLDKLLLETVKKVVQQVVQDGTSLFTYPETGNLYQKLAKHAGVPPECLRITPGSDGAIRNVFEAFISPGDLVLHTKPTFAMYPVYCQMFGAKASSFEYISKENQPHLIFEELLQTIQTLKPKLVCLPNPDSPTGTVLTQAQLISVAEMTQKSNSLLLIDEAYFPYYPGTCVPLLSRFQNVIVARTFAKAWGLAGLRIGFAVANPEIAKVLHQTRPMYEVNTFACAVIEKMLDHENEVKASVKRILESKAIFVSELTQIGYECVPTYGNFAHVKFGRNAVVVHQRLDGKVLYRRDFSEGCLAGYSRFSIGPNDLMQQVLKWIEGK